MIETHQIELEKIKIGMMQHLSPHLMDVSADIRESFLTNSAVAFVEGYLWGETSKADPIQYPADWWQAFKQRWFPRWALAKWPRANDHT